MSSLPSEEGVEKLRQAAARVRELDNESTRLRALIKSHTELLHAAEHERGKQAKEVVELLRSMDVASDGGYGWEHRVVWFLSELATASEQYGRSARAGGRS